MNTRIRFTSSQCAATLIAIIMFTIILLGSSIHAFANSKENQPLHKYYTSIRVDAGDTLWAIAEQYKGESTTTKAYIKEICSLNHINEHEIHTGDYIVISYYSSDLK